MTRALILAAGQGTRLRPLTNNRPKCLVPLLGKSLLERQICTLQKAGITNIHITTGYCAEQVDLLGFATTFNKDFAKTNMVESLFCAMDFIQQKEDLIIAYGDIVYQDENLGALLECQDEIALMIDANWKELWCVRLDNPLDDAETLVMDDDGYVTELGVKPNDYERIHGQYTGLIKIRADKVENFIHVYKQLNRSAKYDGKDFRNMYMTSFLQLLIDRGWKAKAVLVHNGWLEIDSVTDLEEYESLAQRGELGRFYKAER